MIFSRGHILVETQNPILLMIKSWLKENCDPRDLLLLVACGWWLVPRIGAWAARHGVKILIICSKSSVPNFMLTLFCDKCALGSNSFCDFHLHMTYHHQQWGILARVFCTSTLVFLARATAGCSFYRVSQKKFLLAFELYLRENIKFSCSNPMDFFLSISGIAWNTEPFLADI